MAAKRIEATFGIPKELYNQLVKIARFAGVPVEVVIKVICASHIARKE